MFIRRFRSRLAITMMCLTCSMISLSAVERSMLHRALGLARSSWQLLQDAHRTSWGKAGLCTAIAAGLSYRFDRSRLLWKICGVAASVAYAQAVIDSQYAKCLLGILPTLPKGMVICTNSEHQLIPFERTLFKAQGNVRVWGTHDNTGLSLLGEKDGNLLIGDQVWPVGRCSHGVLPPGYIVCVNRQHTFDSRYQQVVHYQVNDFNIRVLRSRAVSSKSVSIIGDELIVKDDVNNIRLQLPVDVCLHGA